MIAQLKIKESLQEQSLRPIFNAYPSSSKCTKNRHIKTENQNNQLNAPFMIHCNYNREQTDENPNEMALSCEDSCDLISDKQFDNFEERYKTYEYRDPIPREFPRKENKKESSLKYLTNLTYIQDLVQLIHNKNSIKPPAVSKDDSCLPKQQSKSNHHKNDKEESKTDEIKNMIEYLEGLYDDK